jgi:hypothetical protein
LLHNVTQQSFGDVSHGRFSTTIRRSTQQKKTNTILIIQQWHRHYTDTSQPVNENAEKKDL